MANKFANIKDGDRDRANKTDLTVLLLLKNKISNLLYYYMKQDENPDVILKILYSVLKEYSNTLYSMILLNKFKINNKKKYQVINRRNLL